VTPGSSLGSRPRSNSLLEHACSVAGGAVVTFLILWGLSRQADAPAETDEPAIQEVRAVDLPEPPPPPPETGSPTAQLPSEINFEAAATASVVKISPTPVPTAPLLDVARPNVSLNFSFTPGAFRPNSKTWEQDSNHVFQRSEVDQRAVPVYRKKPDISNALYGELKSPRVTVVFVVNADGSVESVRISRPNHPDFDRLVVEALKQWRFRPAMRKGKTVRQLAEMTLIVKRSSGNPFTTN
jgi:periplasmic protein TonB